MKKREQDTREYFSNITQAIDTAYEEWVKQATCEFPVLSILKDGKPVPNPIYRHAARYGLTVILHSIQTIWSYAADIVGADVDKSVKRHDNFLHLTNMTFLPAEIGRHAYSASRLLTYQATASERASDMPNQPIPDNEFGTAALDLFMLDREMSASMFDYVAPKLGINGVPVEKVYVPLEYRCEVFKRVLSSLFSEFEDIKTVDTGFRLMNEQHEDIITHLSRRAFASLASTKPCSKHGCSMHRYYFEHCHD
ncbi:MULTISPECIES: hypothetical protein [Vibrio]|uniref:Uncharacterized protein n=1 Tax=Vibrio cholerae TaxID=666 RepID=A0A7Z7VK69_VIBCL|nr:MULTISPECIES: hypothetical protein [Vibrio]PNV69434.1 hypothetical protein C1Y48_18285 [Vibrio cholerae]TBM36604.1 hypothetical protein EYB64_19635 [Vibrio cholerae]BEI26182.1 hypothetical protein KKIDH5335_45140 [Vibrio fluvialis]CQB46349.1 hypothetical protein [Vibrio cholerae]